MEFETGIVHILDTRKAAAANATFIQVKKHGKPSQIAARIRCFEAVDKVVLDAGVYEAATQRILEKYNVPQAEVIGKE